jgi:hypothetical protein
MRGRKALPTLVKLATGNRGNQVLPKGEPMPEGLMVKPDWLVGEDELRLWADLVRMCFWLREPDSPKAAAWCVLQAEFPTQWRTWEAARWQVWRTLGCELGLDPSSRARMGMVKRGTKAEDPAKKYFNVA